jgi:WD40 repeat protein
MTIFLIAGDIYIWDQESGTLLHVIRGQAFGADITCIAWNRVVEDPYMFAAGSHDGTVRVWTREDHTGHMSEETIQTRGYKEFLTGFTRSASPYQMDPASSTSLHSLEDPRSFLAGDG